MHCRPLLWQRAHALFGKREQGIQGLNLHAFTIWIDDFPLTVLADQEI
jgi:hypothetical protein